VSKYKTLILIFSFIELNNQDRTMALFLFQSMYNAEFTAGISYEPSIKASLCRAERAIKTHLFQLSKLSPLKIFETKGCARLSEG